MNIEYRTAEVIISAYDIFFLFILSFKNYLIINIFFAKKPLSPDKDTT